MVKRFSIGLLFVLLACVLFAISFSFLDNPLIFDDQAFSSTGFLGFYAGDKVHFLPRWWVYKSFFLQVDLLAGGVSGLRIVNLALHWLVCVSLYLFIVELYKCALGQVAISRRVQFAAFLAACAFAMHPWAMFAQGYLVQRTILCATGFSLLSLAAFCRGLEGSRLALWLSCLLFVGAIYAKEHVVMLPLVTALLIVLRVRSGLKVALGRGELLSALTLQCLVSLVVVYQVINGISEPLAEEVMLDESSIPLALLHPLSALNQAGLFFKYLGMWVMPNPAWVSIDMREVFPLNFQALGLWFGVFCFSGYMLLGSVFLWRGGVIGLIGFSMLAPGGLFFTEFSSLRLQEVFVLYRSYLWTPFLFVMLALIIIRARNRVVVIVLPLFLIFLGALSFDRLLTLSKPFLVWSEAAKLYERNQSNIGVFGGYRIYYNLGNAWYQEGILESALEKYRKALELKPDYGFAYHQRGLIFLDLKRWDEARKELEMAINFLPRNAASFMALSLAYEGFGRNVEAEKYAGMACRLDVNRCKKADLTSDAADTRSE